MILKNDRLLQRNINGVLKVVRYLIFGLVISFVCAACTKKSSDSDQVSSEDDISATSNSSTNNTVTSTFTAPLNFTDGDKTLSLSESPTFNWSAVENASRYEIAIGTSQGATDTLAWTNVGSSTTYQAQGLVLSANQAYFASVRAVNQDDVKSDVVSGDGWDVTECPVGYILVPEESTPGLGGSIYTSGSKTKVSWSGPTASLRDHGSFCVMKYEAKQHATLHIAVSTPSDTPWVNIEREIIGTDNDAQEACENNGPDFQLIGNHHWQAIARNIEGVSSNFDTSGGATNHAFNRGHADNDPSNTLSADADDSNGCLGIVSNGNPADNCGGSWHINKRTHTLSNGEVIWDFVGNVWEWLRDDITEAQGTNAPILNETYNFAIEWGPQGDYSAQGAPNRAGLGHGFFSPFNGAVARSGDFNGGQLPGLFHTDLSRNKNFQSSGIGFRCVYAP